jgi:uncharacterized membrane protein YfcA
MNDEMSFTTALLLTIAGICSGFLNTVASSGSAVTLPIMIALGLNPVTANATNRVPVVVGLAAAVWKYHRSGQLHWREGFRLSVPTIAGAVLGTFMASSLGDMKTGYLTTFAVLFAMAVVLSNPSKWLNSDQSIRTKNMGPLVQIALFAVGIWTGLIVLDSGTMFLAVLVMMAHYPIREANAIKAWSMGLPSLMAVMIFTAKGDVNWSWAVPLSVGGILGSLIGTRVSLGPNASKWVFWVLILVLGVQVIQLTLRYI